MKRAIFATLIVGGLACAVFCATRCNSKSELLGDGSGASNSGASNSGSSKSSGGDKAAPAKAGPVSLEVLSEHDAKLKVGKPAATPAGSSNGSGSGSSASNDGSASK